MIGICNLSNISLRHDPESKSEIVSQLLFGETFSIIEEVEGWSKIIIDDDKYTGWISSKQFEILESEIKQRETAIVFPFVTATSIKGNIMIPAGSTLPNLTGNQFEINGITYHLLQENLKYAIDSLSKIAVQYINTPYFWGGRSPFGIDCSGFVQTVYKQCGVQLKRDAWQQAEQGSLVSFLEEAVCGDLAFFDNDEGKIIHVGMMLDNNKIIHSSGKVRIDSIDNFGIMNMDEKQYSHKLRIIKRMV